MTRTSEDGMPIWRCIASAPVSRKPKNNAAGKTHSGFKAASSAMAIVLKQKPFENP